MVSPYSIMHFSIHGEERAFTFKIVFCRFMDMEVTLDYLFLDGRRYVTRRETVAAAHWGRACVVNARAGGGGPSLI